MIHIEFQARRPSFEGTVVTAPEGTRVSVNHDGREVSSIDVCAEPPTSAKETFLAVCAEWADLLIDDGAKSKTWGNAITSDPEQMVPKVFYGEPQDYRTMAVIASDALLGREIGEGETEAKLIDDLAQKFADCITITPLPDSQRKVWLAAWQLILDSYDAAEQGAK